MSEKPTPRSKFNFEFPPNAPPLSSATSSTQPSSAEGNQDVEDLKMSQNPTPRRSIFNLDFPPNAPPLSSATSSTQPTTAEGTSKSGNYSSIANPFVSSKPTTGTSVFGAPPASGTDTSTQPESLIKGPFSVPGPDGICTSSYFTIEPEASDSFVKSFLSGTLPGFPLGGATKPTTDTSASDVTPLFGAATSTQPPTGSGFFKSGTSTASPFGVSKPTTGTSASDAPPLFGAAPSTQPTGRAFGQPVTTASLFGGGALGGGGGFAQQNFSSANNAQSTATTGLFGASKPAPVPTPTTGSFNSGTSSSTASPFGGLKPTTGTSLFGDPPASGTATTTQRPTGGAFGQPATTSVSSELGGGALGGGAGFTKLNFGFGNNTQSSTTTGLLGANKPAPGPTPTTAFGQPATTSVSSELGGGALGGGAGFTKLNFGFGNDTQSSTTTGLLGGNKPAPGPTLTTGNLNNTALDAMQDLRNELKKFQENLLAAVRSEFQLLRDDLSKMDLVTHDTVPKQLSQTSDTVPKQPPRSRSPKLD